MAGGWQVVGVEPELSHCERGEIWSWRWKPPVLFLLKDFLKGFSVSLLFGLSAFWGGMVGLYCSLAMNSESQRTSLQTSVCSSLEWR